MYSVLRKLLFTLDPETAHDVSLDCLGAAERLRLLSLFTPKLEQDPVELLGLRFPNPVGLSAGLDKNGDYFNALGQLGFGFVEIGTVTPQPQAGNPKPRMFRLPEHEAIINRLGFNNKGVDYLVERVKQRRFTGIIGINIGKNKMTAEADALSDYEIAMTAVYPYADYITVNISSPNTPGLRNLQFGDNLDRLLEGLAVKQQQLTALHQRRVPVLIKIAPDMNAEEVANISRTFLKHAVDGVIATNTTLDKSAVSDSPFAEEMGGLSGAPLTQQSTLIIKQLREHLGQEMPIIGVGGIQQGSDAVEKLAAGANLVQLYSGFIYRGPALIKDARQAIMQNRKLS
ncbi:MAG: dihydroorotate dehydrogenase [Kiritimatiellia bacterium]|jgi:dihydroorotate dehydrogenase